MSSPASYSKQNADSDDWIISSNQMINISRFLWNESSKIQFLLTSDPLSVGGC